MKKIKIFTCYHKPSIFVQNSIVTPIQGGKSISKIDLGILGDNTGDNISNKNQNYCELTVLYWIWKNLSDYDYIGLQHYRRFFNFTNTQKKFHILKYTFLEDYGFTNKNISNILKNYDIILPSKSNLRVSLYEHYKKNHVIEDMDLVLKLIKRKYPEMYEESVNILNDKYMYIANMFVMSRDLFNEYMNWLFDILFDLEKIIQKDVNKRDVYQKRVYGFLSERLETVFILYKLKVKNLKIKEVPILFHENSLKKYLRYQIKILKRKILTFLGYKKEYW